MHQIDPFVQDIVRLPNRNIMVFAGEMDDPCLPSIEKVHIFGSLVDMRVDKYFNTINGKYSSLGKADSAFTPYLSRFLRTPLSGSMPLTFRMQTLQGDGNVRLLQTFRRVFHYWGKEPIDNHLHLVVKCRVRFLSYVILMRA